MMTIDKRRAAASRRSVVAGALAACVAAALVRTPRALAQATTQCANDDAKCIDLEARRFLNLGDAEAAVDQIPRAREYWQDAVDVGTPVGSQAADTARTRLQMYTLTCTYDAKSLAEIANPDTQALLNVRVYQNALKALGYYQGPLDGELTVKTRLAIRKFQNDMAFSQTDTLLPRQVVFLVCNGAATARNADAQTTLGLMHAAGVGVKHSINFALAWLRTAAATDCGEASFYLALLHGTGYCGFPHGLEHADQYLKDACRQKHSGAVELMRLYGKDPNLTSRWAKIGANPTVKKCLALITKNCGGSKEAGEAEAPHAK